MLPILTMSAVFNSFIIGVFGSYVIFSLAFMFGLAILMVLANMPAQFIIAGVGIMNIIFYAIFGGLVLQITTSIFVVLLGIMTATAIYSLFRHGL